MVRLFIAFGIWFRIYRAVEQKARRYNRYCSNVRFSFRLTCKTFKQTLGSFKRLNDGIPTRIPAPAAGRCGDARTDELTSVSVTIDHRHRRYICGPLAGTRRLSRTGQVDVGHRSRGTHIDHAGHIRPTYCQRQRTRLPHHTT